MVYSSHKWQHVSGRKDLVYLTQQSNTTDTFQTIVLVDTCNMFSGETLEKAVSHKLYRLVVACSVINVLKINAARDRDKSGHQ